MNWSDALKALIPIVVASIAWLPGEVSSFNPRLRAFREPKVL